MDILLYAILMSLPFLPAAFAWYRLRTKGYGRLVVAAFLSISMFACFAVYFGTMGASDDPSNAAMTNLQALGMFVGVPLSWSVLALAVAYAIPSRGPKRIAGPRKSRFPRFFGWAITTIGGALALFFVAQLISPTIVPRGDGLEALMVVIAVTFPLAHYWFALDRRMRFAPTVLEKPEGSVLYLRAFDAERQAFVSGDKAVLSRYTDQVKAHMPLARGKRNRTVSLTLEDYLEESISAKLGQFIGLGSPGDDVPPDGATREYAQDANWKDRFSQLADGAKCIILALGESANLQWELGQIRQRGLSSKLCMFTAPRVADAELGSITRAIRSETSLQESLTKNWAVACQTLRGAGYECEAIFPGQGAAIAFDATGRSVVLTTDASTPDEFIVPVADWFNVGKKSGRCVPAACKECQRPIYRPIESKADDQFCFACRQIKKLARMSTLDRLLEMHPMLATIWGIVSLVIAVLISRAIGADVKSWLSVALWAIVAASPWVLQAGVCAVRRRISSS